MGDAKEIVLLVNASANRLFEHFDSAFVLAGDCNDWHWRRLGNDFANSDLMGCFLGNPSTNWITNDPMVSETVSTLCNGSEWCVVITSKHTDEGTRVYLGGHGNLHAARGGVTTVLNEIRVLEQRDAIREADKNE